MSEVAFLIKQIDKNGDETGLVRIAVGRTSARRFIQSCGGSGSLESIDSMEEGGFDPILYGSFIYEVECFRKEQLKDVVTDGVEVIQEHDYDVYEVTDGDASPRHAFGEQGLFDRLDEIGVARKEFDGLVPDSPGTEKEVTLTDPVERRVVIRSLTDDEIRKASSDPEFKAELVVSRSLAESSEECEEEYGGFKVKARNLDYGRNEYVISLPDGRWVQTGHGYGGCDDAMKSARKVIDDRPPEFVGTLKSLGVLEESTKPAGEGCEFDYCQKHVKVEVRDGKVVATVGPCTCGKLEESSGQTVKTMKAFRSVDEATEAARFGIDCGICESAGGYRVVRFNAAAARKAYDATGDSPYLDHNTRWISPDALTYVDDEDETLTTELVEQLADFGVDEDEFTIEDVEDLDDGEVEKTIEFPPSMAARAQQVVDDLSLGRTRWIATNVVAFVDDAEGSVEAALMERLKEAGIPADELEVNVSDDHVGDGRQ